MAKANASAEPSMEEILASIRRIISDDTPAAPAAAAKPAPAAAKPPEKKPEPAATHVSEDDLDRLFAKGGDDADLDPADDVMDLGEAAMVAEDEPLDLVEGLLPDEADVQFVDKADEPAEDDWGLAAEPEPAPAPPPKPAAKAPPPAPKPEPVRARAEPEEEAEPLVSPQTGATVNAAFGQLTHTILAQNAKTLDDLVKEMLRPMLKGWLDENLPTIVERLVRAEIERVSRGR
jgi:cell pole-organizing protein PopZ